MTKAARFAAFLIAIVAGPVEWLSSFFKTARHPKAAAGLVTLAFVLSPPFLSAQADCLASHGDKTMQNAQGHSISVDGDKFSASTHGSLQCNNCHADIKEYPHPDHIAKVECKSCHAAAHAGRGRR